MSSTEKVLKATIKLVDNFTKPMNEAVKKTKELNNTHRELAKKLGKPIEFLFKFDNKIHSYINKIKEQHSRLKNSFKEYLSVKIESSKAIVTINILKRHFSVLQKLKTVKAIVNLTDKASPILSKINGKLKSFVGKVWSATVSIKDNASSMISSLQGKLTALAGGISIGVAAKTGFEGLSNEQTEKLTINRVIQNSGQSSEEAKKATDEFYSYLKEYANKTPFETSAVTQFGTKAMMMSNGNVDQAKNITDMMGNVKAFVGNLRTETEVAEAFFSASNGNLEMLNNMLGTQYETFEEAQEGIAKNQGGLVDEMSTTLSGLTSTITGKLKNSVKGVTKVFEDVLSNNLKKAIDFIDIISPKLVTVAENVKKWFETFAKSEPASQYMNIFKTVFEVAFDMIKTVIETVKPIIESIFKFIGEHSEEISTIIKILGTLWSSTWKTIGTILKGAWDICEPILDSIFKALSKVKGIIENVCDWWNKMMDLLKTPINATVSIVKSGTSWINDKLGLSSGKNAFGSGRIARDGTIRTLHEGEKVLTKQEANRYEKGSNNQSINIVVNGLTVREDADINKIATQLLKKINENKIVYGGTY
jgi:hypothetical protein